MALQLEHHQMPPSHNTSPIILLTDHLHGPANIGALFRLADAFHIEKIIFCGTPPHIESRRLKKVARATLEETPYQFAEEILPVIQSYRQQGYTLCCLEITANSIPIEDLSLKENEKMLLVVGNERLGIDETVLKISDKNLHIPMFGKNSSMNITHASAIALYEIRKKSSNFNKK